MPSNQNTIQKTTFTFILEFRGGTYIEQIAKKKLKTAFKSWVKRISSKSHRQYFSVKEQNFFKEIESNTVDLVPIDKLKNIWCHYFIYKKRLYHVHIMAHSNEKIID